MLKYAIVKNHNFAYYFSSTYTKRFAERRIAVMVSTTTKPYRLPSRQTAAITPVLSRLGERLTAFWNSRYYFPAMLLAAAFPLLAGQTLLGVGIMVLAARAYLALCADLVAAVFPILLIFLLGTEFYDNIGGLFLEARWIAPLAACAVFFRCVRFRGQSFAKGACTKSLVAVSVATVLGGLGSLSAKDYFSPVALYYAIGLGPAMLLLYSLFQSVLRQKRTYDLGQRLAALFYAAGLFTVLIVAWVYIKNWQLFVETRSSIYFSYRNYCATMLLLALPMPCFFLRKNGRHLLGLGIMYGALLMTGSRTGLLFGSALAAASLCWAFRYSPWLQRNRQKFLWLLLPAAAVLAVFAKRMFLSRMTGGTLISPTDSRVTFFLQGMADFAASPVFGRGLGAMDNRNIFIGVPGSIVWYHNAVAQVLGSMGLVGAIAYLWQFAQRLSLLWKLRGTPYSVFLLVYLGMVAVSMTNPGLFCPFPNAFLMILLFAVAEQLAPQEAMATKKRLARSKPRLPAILPPARPAPAFTTVEAALTAYWYSMDLGPPGFLFDPQAFGNILERNARISGGLFFSV